MNAPEKSEHQGGKVPSGRHEPAGNEPASDPRRHEPDAPADADEHVRMFLQEAGEVAQHVIELEARDTARSREAEAILAREKAAKTESFYSDLIYTLTNLRYDEQEARILWINLLAHKVEMSDKLGRNVGIRVAALDYFRNILGMLDDVKIIDAEKYVETAQLAVTDGLTGIFNHRYFQDRLARDIQRAREDGVPVALIMMDIDNFKTYNDVNGHIAGDVALKEVAASLRKSLKRDDLLARYGGEEFAAILYGVDKERAMQVADRLRGVIASRPFPNEKILPGGKLTISCGLAVFPEDAKDRGDLIARADAALYHAKRSGRNRVSAVPSDMRRHPRVRVSLPLSIRHAEYREAPPVGGRAVNLSAGGMNMILDRPVEVGSVVGIELSWNGERLELTGRVIWRLTGPGSLAQAGIKFVNLSAEAREKLEKTIENLRGR
ncbi:MAG: diguanylate cyclase [Planctomycetota bacterium]|nr:diguanylate cyclase [Planctomycetota bacterium]